MSDTTAVWQPGPSVYARGFVALGVIAAGIVVSVTRGSSPVASAETLLIDSKGATVVSSSGASHAAIADQKVLAGDVVMTGPKGYAELSTRGRLVLLSGGAALQVLDGEHQQLQHGTAVVDAQDGKPGLMLDVAGDTVSIPTGSATEAARDASVRIGALSGPATITSTSGRRLSVPRLSQAVLSGDALPSVTTPLHLSDSKDEARVAPLLVADDIALQTLARGIDTTGQSTARVVEASWEGVRQAVPDSHNRSERVLPVLIADATHGGNAQQRYDDVVTWRAEGGSWGVVLHLLNGRASAVQATLASLQHNTQPAGQIGTVVTQPVGIVTPPGGPTTTVTPPTIGGGTTVPTPPSHPGTGGSTPPTQPPNLLGTLVSTLQNVIDGVLNLLPHDATPDTTATTTGSSGLTSTLTGTKASSESTTTSHPSTKKTPLTAPTSTPSNGLLGNLLGGLLGHH